MRSKKKKKRMRTEIKGEVKLGGGRIDNQAKIPKAPMPIQCLNSRSSYFINQLSRDVVLTSVKISSLLLEERLTDMFGSTLLFPYDELLELLVTLLLLLLLLITLAGLEDKAVMVVPVLVLVLLTALTLRLAFVLFVVDMIVVLLEEELLTLGKLKAVMEE